MVEKHFWDTYTDNFFATVKATDPGLYAKIESQFKLGQGQQVIDLLWEVIKNDTSMGITIETERLGFISTTTIKMETEK